MTKKIIYNGIVFYAFPNWQYGNRLTPFIEFEDKNISKTIKKIIIDSWCKTDQYNDFYDAEEFKSIIDNCGKNKLNNIWWDLSYFKTNMERSEKQGYAYLEPNTLEEIYQKDMDKINFLKRLLSNSWINNTYKKMIKEFISKHKPRKPKYPISGYIYLIFTNNLYKIGKSKQINSRTKYFSTIMPIEITLIHSFYSTDYSKAETYLHQKYKAQRKIGEWFELSENQVKEICAIKDNEI